MMDDQEELVDEAKDLEDDKDKDLQDLKNAFAEEYFKTGINELVAFDMINAYNGMKFTLDIELIKYVKF